MSDEPGVTTPQLARVVVQGASGSGKTTLATAIAAALGVAHLELDGVYQQANWTPLDLEEFRARVQEFVAQPRWVVDGNYSQVRDILWPLATIIVLIDLPRRVVMTRVIKRTFLRIMKRERLWNGNREKWSNALSRDPMNNIILWSGTATRAITMWSHATRARPWTRAVTVLTSARDVRAFLSDVTLAR